MGEVMIVETEIVVVMTEEEEEEETIVDMTTDVVEDVEVMTETEEVVEEVTDKGEEGTLHPRIPELFSEKVFLMMLTKMMSESSSSPSSTEMWNMSTSSTTDLADSREIAISSSITTRQPEEPKRKSISSTWENVTLICTRTLEKRVPKNKKKK